MVFSTLVRELGESVDIYDIPLDLARFTESEGEGPLVAFLETRIRFVLNSQLKGVDGLRQDDLEPLQEFIQVLANQLNVFLNPQKLRGGSLAEVDAKRMQSDYRTGTTGRGLTGRPRACPLRPSKSTIPRI